MRGSIYTQAIKLIEQTQAALDRLNHLHMPPPGYQPPRYAERPPAQQGKGGFAPNRQPPVTPSYVQQRQRQARMRPSGGALAWLMMIFGALSGMFFSLGTIFSFFTALPVVLFNELLAIGFYLCPAVVAWVVFAGGNSMHQLNLRFRRYIVEIGDAKFCDIAYLAQALSLPLKRVQMDFKRLVHSGAIPRAYFDDKMTCLMLDEETFRQYLALQQSQRQKELEAMAKPAPVEDESQPAPESEEYLRRIREANDAMPGELISQKLTRLEGVTTQIFRYVEQHPDKQPEIRRLMQYHLPTTLKLVDTYRKMESQRVQGENVARIKEEILASLDTVNDAFEKLLNDLFNDVVLDVSSDISVLKTMLAQEGLTGCDDFKRS